MGRTIPSFRIASHLEEKEWKRFRNSWTSQIENTKGRFPTESLLMTMIQQNKLIDRLMSIIQNASKSNLNKKYNGFGRIIEFCRVWPLI
jgi:hypothetical protein